MENCECPGCFYANNSFAYNIKDSCLSLGYGQGSKHEGPSHATLGAAGSAHVYEEEEQVNPSSMVEEGSPEALPAGLVIMEDTVMAKAPAS